MVANSTANGSWWSWTPADLAGAYLASVANAAAADGWAADLAPGWAEALADVCARTGWSVETVTAVGRSQQDYSKAVDARAFQSLLSQCEQFDRARLLSVSGDGASLWLGAVPSASLGYILDAREFTTALKLWFGMNIYDAPFACPGCGAAMDLVGYHALSCTHLGSFGVRHNALRDVFLRFLSLAGIEAEREASSLLPGTAARPADILLPSFESPGIGACLDFAVTHPQQPNFVNRAGASAGAAAELYETTVKEAKFGKDCKAAGLVLIPMVVETFGRWGERAEEAFRFVAKACAARSNEKSTSASSHLRRALSVALLRSNVRILLGRLDPNAPFLGDPVLAADDPILSPAVDEVLAWLDRNIVV